MFCYRWYDEGENESYDTFATWDEAEAEADKIPGAYVVDLTEDYCDSLEHEYAADYDCDV